MPSSQKLLLRLFASLAALCGIAAAVFLYIALNTTYDVTIRHFTAGSSPARLAAVFAAAGVLLSAAAGISLVPRRAVLRPGFTPLVSFTSLLCAFLLIAAFIWTVRAGLPSSVLSIVRLALMGLSAAYFFLVGAQRSSSGTLLPLLSLLPILFAFASVLVMYFSSEYGMNAPVKSYDLMMYLSMALFFTAETRAALDRTQTPGFVFFSLLCFVLCIAVAVPQLVISLHDTLGHGFSMTESAVAVAAALYAAARLLSLRAPADGAAKEVPDAAE